MLLIERSLMNSHISESKPWVATYSLTVCSGSRALYLRQRFTRNNTLNGPSGNMEDGLKNPKMPGSRLTRSCAQESVPRSRVPMTKTGGMQVRSGQLIAATRRRRVLGRHAPRGHDDELGTRAVQ